MSSGQPQECRFCPPHSFSLCLLWVSARIPPRPGKKKPPAREFLFTLGCVMETRFPRKRRSEAWIKGWKDHSPVLTFYRSMCSLASKNNKNRMCQGFLGQIENTQDWHSCCNALKEAPQHHEVSRECCLLFHNNNGHTIASNSFFIFTNVPSKLFANQAGKPSLALNGSRQSVQNCFTSIHFTFSTQSG